MGDFLDTPDLVHWAETYERICRDPIKLRRLIEGYTNDEGRFIPGAIERNLFNTEAMDENGMKKYGVPLILPPHSYEFIFKALYKGDLHSTKKKKILVFQPRGTYKTLAIAVVLYLFTIMNPLSTSIMIVAPSEKQATNILNYLQAFYSSTPNSSKDFWNIINRVLKPKINYKEKILNFIGRPGSGLRIFLTYNERCASTIRSAHVPLIIVDECAQVPEQHILTLEGNLNLGGKMLLTTTPGIDGMDWTQKAFVHWVINSEKDITEFSDAEYVKKILDGKEVSKAFADYEIIRTTIDKVMNNRGRCPNVLYTPDSIAAFKADCFALGKPHLYEADIELKWPAGTGGLVFPDGLQPCYSKYLPGREGFLTPETGGRYYEIVMGIDVGWTDCATVFAVFGKIDIPVENGLKQPVIRLIHLEEMHENRAHIQVERMKQIIREYEIPAVVVDENGSSNPFHKHVMYLIEEQKDELLSRIEIDVGKWGDSQTRREDYSFLNVAISNNHIYVPDPDYLIGIAPQYTGDAEYFRDYLMLISKLVTNASAQFKSLVYVATGKDKRQMSIHKTGKYADFPDAFAFAMKRISNTLDIKKLAKLSHINVGAAVERASDHRTTGRTTGRFRLGGRKISTDRSSRSTRGLF